MFNFIKVDFLISFKWAFYVFLLSKVIPRILMILVYGIGVLFKCTSKLLYFLNLVKREQRDFLAENVKLVLEDHSYNKSIVSCRAGYMEFGFFPLQRMFRLSAKSVDCTGNLIFSHISFIAIRNRVTDIVDPWGTPF